MLLTKTTVAENEVLLSYHRVRGLYFLAVVFAATIIVQNEDIGKHHKQHLSVGLCKQAQTCSLS